MLLSDAITYYLDHCISEDGKPKEYHPDQDRLFLEKGTTAKSIQSDLNNFQRFGSKRRRLEGITNNYFKIYLASQKSRSSAYRRLYSLRKFFLYCVHKGWIEKFPELGRSQLPGKDILPYKERRCVDRPSDHDINRVLKLVRDPLTADPSRFVAISLLLSGLKSNEVLSIPLTKPPFQVRGASVTIELKDVRSTQQGRKRKESPYGKRVLPLSPRVNSEEFLKYLQMLINRRDIEGGDIRRKSEETERPALLLPYNKNTLSQLFTTLCRRAKISILHPRDLRLIAMMDQKDNGVSTEKIAFAFGVTTEYIERELGCK